MIAELGPKIKKGEFWEVLYCKCQPKNDPSSQPKNAPLGAKILMVESHLR